MPGGGRFSFYHLSFALLLTIAICARTNAVVTVSAKQLPESRLETGDQDDEEAIIRELLNWAKTKGMSDVLRTSPVKVRFVKRSVCLFPSPPDLCNTLDMHKP